MRPYVISHMMSSIDGRSLVERWTPPADGVDQKVLRSHYDACAAKLKAQGWMVGRRSMKPCSAGRFNHADGYAAQPGRDDHVHVPAGASVAVVFDPAGRLAYDGDSVDGDRIVAILGPTVSESYLARLRDQGISYILAGANGHDLRAALAALRQKGPEQAECEIVRLARTKQELTRHALAPPEGGVTEIRCASDVPHPRGRCLSG